MGNYEVENYNQGKSKLAAMLLCFFLGSLGVHRFYLNKIGTGILWLLTGGCCGIGAIVDFFMICLNKTTDNNGNPLMKDISDEASRVFAIVVAIMMALPFIAVIGICVVSLVTGSVLMLAA